MQALPRVWRINRRHPDAGGCVVALPLVERGGTSPRDAVSKFAPGWTAAGGFLPSQWGTIHGGSALGTLTADDGLIHNTAFNYGSGFEAMTIMVRVKKEVSTAAASQTIVCCSNVGIIDRLQQFGYVNDNLSVFAVAGPTGVVGQHYTLGLRVRPGVANPHLFVDGERFTVTVTPSAFSATALGIGNTASVVQTFQGKIRDVRIWNRWMPDAAFERYYRNPLAFYQVARGATGPSFGVPGNFFPFLHPSLTS